MLPRKILGVLGSYGTPKYTDYYCNEECVIGHGADPADSEPLEPADFVEQWVTRRADVRCCNCDARIFLDSEIPPESPID